MTTPQQQIEQDLTAAMKARQKEKVSTLRMLLAAIKNEHIRLGEEIDEDSFLNLVQKSIKQRQDSIEQYRQGNREDLATKEEREAEILTAYLPPPVGEDEIRTAIEQFVATEGLVGVKGMGAVMKEMLTRFSGRTDGGTINRIARDILTETD
jgi:uncharacterized protein YqeY